MTIPPADIRHGLALSVSPGETRGAVIEDGRLVELLVQRPDAASRVGEIHRGRVTAVDRVIGAAFVDLGAAGEGFLSLEGAAPIPPEGASLLVQIERDADEGKRWGLSRRVALPSRRLVLTVGGEVVEVSRRIADAAERFRLKSRLADLARPGEGWTARTAAAGMSDAEILAAMARLREEAEGLSEDGPPALLRGEDSAIEKLLRDLVDPAMDMILVDDGAALAKARLSLEGWAPELAEKLRRPPNGLDAFAWAEIDEQIEAALARRVALPGGGALLIDRTPTLTAIDVDLGSGSGGRAVNLAAAAEAARQIRLRDIGGIILIDFLRMKERADREAVQAALVAASARDRRPPQVLGWTRGGLLELTRPRGRAPLARLLETNCSACMGLGRVADPMSQALASLRAVLAWSGPGAPKLVASPPVFRALRGVASAAFAETAARFGGDLPLESGTTPACGYEVSPR